MCFSLQVVSATISRDVTVTSTRVLSCGARVCLLQFLGIFTYIFVLYTGSENVPELRVVARWCIWADPWESRQGLLNGFCSSSAKWATAGWLFWPCHPVTYSLWQTLNTELLELKKKRYHAMRTRHWNGFFFCLFFFSCTTRKSTGVGS